MKAILVKMALLVALCVSVTSQSVRANDILQDIAAGIQVVSFLNDITKSNKTTGKQARPVATLRENRAAADPENSRRVMIDESQMNISGGYGSQLQEMMASRFRSIVSQTGKVTVVIGQSDTQTMADLQDGVQESGRYSKKTRAEVKRGKWMAPTDIMKMSGTAEVLSDDRQVGFQTNQGGLNLSSRKITAIVHLVLEPIEIVSGVYGRSYESSVKLTKVVDLNINGYGSGMGGDSNSNQQNAETELLYQAVQQVLIDLADQLDPEELVVVGKVKRQPEKEPVSIKTSSVTGEVKLLFPSGKPSQINIPVNKPVNVGNQIWFVRQGKALGKFKVIAINGQNLKLQKISGAEPSEGDGFAIFN